MPTIPPTIRLGVTTPQDAVNAFQGRGLLAPSYSWQDAWHEDHATQLMIAGVTQADVLQVAQDALAQTVSTGSGLKAFSAALRPALQKAGLWGDVEITDPATGETRVARFDDARLQLIYDTNVRQSYAAGQWAAAQRGKARRPMLMYRTMRDERVRHAHAAWDGVVLPIDDPWWRTHYPPNGWRCRCRAIPVNEAEVQQYVSAGVLRPESDTAGDAGAVTPRLRTTAPPVNTYPWTNRRTGEISQVPAGIDPGWAYNAGIARADAVSRLTASSLQALPTPVARAAVEQQLRSAAGAAADALAQPVPGLARPVAVLDAAQARLAGAAGSAIVTADASAQAALRGLRGPDLLNAQLAIQQGQRLPGTGADALYALVQQGWVLLATVRAGAAGPELVDYIRLPLAQARIDPRLSAWLDGAGAPAA